MLIGAILLAILDRFHPTMGTTTLTLATRTPLLNWKTLRDFITTQKAFNKNVEEKLAKLDNLSLKVESLALDIEMLKNRTSSLEENKATPINAIQLQINENIRMMAKLKERWDREKEEEDRIKSLPTHHTVATIQIVEDTQTISTQCT